MARGKKRSRRLLTVALALVMVLAAASLLNGWYGAGPLPEDHPVIVPDGASLNTISIRLQNMGAIYSARAFRFHAKLFGARDKIRAGEFMLPAGVSESGILTIITGDEALRRFVTIPEGLPSVMVADRLAAQSFLTGPVPTPDEGSVLPETYDFQRGATRASVVARMQAAMTKTLDEEWAKRADGLPVKTKQEALVLASSVETETGKASARPMVAGLYENRLKKGIMLQADPTIIYPITKGKPLGRRIRQSEILAVNGYNTYSMAGLPRGPITNPGRASIDAVLHPAQTDALYMVADGTGGHAFATTLEEHNRNVERWFAIRHARGEL